MGWMGVRTSAITENKDLQTEEDEINIHQHDLELPLLRLRAQTLRHATVIDPHVLDALSTWMLPQESAQ